MKWNPDQYLKFVGERTRPAMDLVAKIELENPKSIIDIGCGPGNSTQVLRSRWPNGSTAGLDSSRDMTEKAAEDLPEAEWICADATSYTFSKKYDIVFSNAAIQWMPDHDTLLPRLFDVVAEGGRFAVQVPSDADSPLRRALISVASQPRWKNFVSGAEKLITYHESEYYYDILAPLASHFDLWNTTYYHVMQSHTELVEWYKGTGMKPFLERIPTDDDRNIFERQVLEECSAGYSIRKDGKLLYPFKRTFFIASK